MVQCSVPRSRRKLSCVLAVEKVLAEAMFPFRAYRVPFCGDGSMDRYGFTCRA